MSENSLQQVQAQLASIRDMVAALNADYERLEELRDLRVAMTQDDEVFAETYPDEADELAELEDAAGDCRDAEDARDRILQDALSVEVRDAWRSPSEESVDPCACEYRILLCWGGPSAQLVGSLGDHNEPETATLMHQDWFEPWQEYTDTSSEDDDALLTYARQFYFGE